MASRSPIHVLEIALDPQASSDRETLLAALAPLCAETPSLAVMVDRESGFVIVKGMEEAQLEAVVERLQRECAAEFSAGEPQVTYRETVAKASNADYTLKKPASGTDAGQFACVRLRLDPLPPGSGFIFENRAPADAVPAQYLPGIEKGIALASEGGSLAGFPLIDLKASLIGGAYDDAVSSPAAFEIATGMALREALAEAGPTLLEPLMQLWVVTPTDHATEALRGLTSRHGTILINSQREGTAIIEAEVLMSSLLGFAAALRDKTNGRAQSSMRLLHFQPTRQRPRGPDARAAAAA
ncbi:MAG TPA: hypothetical protein VET85_00810 [Stellaceae bacterium]|nr:hypothetical protein [Stellaceae bacterium]